MTVKTYEHKKTDDNFQDEEARIHIFAKQMLVSRIFTASYIGRFFVESLNTYRDVIKVFDQEKDLTRDLCVVKNRIIKFYGTAVWPAITDSTDMLDSPSGHCIWLQLKEVAFGDYWFTIEDVFFMKTGEMTIKIKVLRSFEPMTTSQIFKEGTINWNEIKNNILGVAQELITWDNMKESFRFIFLLLMTIATTTVHALKYLGDYSICFFREFNNLIKVCTPIFLAIVDMISKTIGGFYILLAMLWGQRGRQQPLAYPALTAPCRPLRPGLPQLRHQKP